MKYIIISLVLGIGLYVYLLKSREIKEQRKLLQQQNIQYTEDSLRSRKGILEIEKPKPIIKEKEAVLESINPIITSKKYGRRWPFNVKQIELFCDGSDIYFRANNTIYALNGSARGKVHSGKSFITNHDMEEIRKKDPDFQGSKMAIPYEFVSIGLSLCN